MSVKYKPRMLLKCDYYEQIKMVAEILVGEMNLVFLPASGLESNKSQWILKNIIGLTY